MRGELPEIGLGTAQNDDPEICAESVRTALEMGYRMIDTAQMYGNEEYVGEAIQRASVPRDEVFLATKIQPENNSPSDVRRSAIESIERLGVDALDMLYLHWPTEVYEPVETLAVFDELREEGLIDHVGLSNFTLDLLNEAADNLHAPIVAHQVEMHPFLQQEELLAHAQANDHYLVAYSPLAKGAVFDDPDFSRLADRAELNPAQLSLAWLASKDNVVPIPKSETGSHLRANLEAISQAVTDEIIAEIDGLDRATRVNDPLAAIPEGATLRWTPKT